MGQKVSTQTFAQYVICQLHLQFTCISTLRQKHVESISRIISQGVAKVLVGDLNFLGIAMYAPF